MLSRRFILVAPFIACAQSSIEIRFDGKVFRVAGWPPPGVEPEGGWSSLFAVHAGTSRDTPAVLGSYAIQDGDLTFTPRYPVSVKTRAVLRIPGKTPIETVFNSTPKVVN
ncbi:MAG TPA: hypothetical protein VEX68_19140, partial [Bryobacteraceae bacterium]|nr:hypothetical protein [Bryobacteraceae bacterium]